MNSTMQRELSKWTGWPMSHRVLPPVCGGELSARAARIPNPRFFDITALCTRDRRLYGGKAGEERSGAHRG